MRRFVRLAFLSYLFFTLVSICYADTTARLVGNHPVEAEQRVAIANLDATKSLTMEIHLKLRNAAQLQKFLDQLQDPGSPNYHKFLQPGEFDSLYGPRQADIDAVAKWLGDEGFTVTSTAGSVQFTGTVEQAERSFAVHMVKLSAEEFSNQEDPMLPASLASMVANLEGLDNLMGSSPASTFPSNLKKLTAKSSPSRKLTRKEAIARMTHVASPLALVQPSVNIGGDVAYGDVDMRNTYDVSSSTTMGSGDCIAIVGTSDFLDASLTTFTGQFSDLPGFNVTRVVVGSNPGIVSAEEPEADIDLEWSHVMAPGAAQHFYVGNLQDDITQAIKDDTCKVITISFEFCGGSKSFYTGTLDPLFMKAVSQGQSVFISTGDHGAAGSVASSGHCVAGSGSPMVSEMSADPNVTSVGGSEILSPDYNGSEIAQGYATETVWNSGGATGGGASAIFAKPAYQSAPGVPNDGKRDLPDVVLLGGPPLVFIAGDVGGSAQIECCYDGTSLAAPMWAGLAKDLESDLGALGLINSRLYNLGALQYGASATNEGFHDITSGNNSFNGVSGFSAGTGYDKASGLGSVDFGTFKTAFESAPAAPPTTMTASPASTNFGSLNASSISRAKKVLVTNRGKNNGIVGTVAIAGANAGDFTITADGCSGQTIPPKHNCAVMVEFAPAAPIGAESGSLQAPYNGGTATARLAGNSTAVVVKATPITIKFPATEMGATTEAKILTLINESKTASVTLGATPTISFPFVVESDTCSSATLQPHGRCTTKVDATVPSILGATGQEVISGSLTFAFTYGNNAGAAPTVMLSVPVLPGD
jgi:pseudomonalisin